ncbi:polysaccharide biosynthesis tyrosine autokinase [Parapedobacter sp. ISTM3]|uniref:Capsular exopolysaccharide family n=1 Tax=Parapedobacter luteus TaxID=623280 RepID=A0A1T5A7J9_9SPHI|nr:MULTISPECIES: polysaccharide biosynthesis tyrosine autokinase [Parapedobacter]MBK1442227.1 polysaccharide biosynthesis tyrosine autokinase [Parapedobacter sp. ISTM3]SKB30633.1 capsular exopolysaccharide family [Parapedobacter luteus]
MDAKLLNLPPQFADLIEQDKPKDFRLLLSKYLYHWPLFLLCLFFTLAGAFLYISYRQPAYTVRAKLTLSDEAKSTADKLAVQQLGFNVQKKEVKSQVEVLKSRKLILSVVSRLQLWTNYFHTDYRKRDLWKNTPLKLTMVQPSGLFKKDHTYLITIDDSTHFTLKKKDGTELSATFNDTLSDDFGRWKLTKTDRFDSFIGKTIRIEVSDPNKVVTRYQKEIMVTLDKVDPIVDLSLTDVIPERGSAILDMLIEAYEDYNVTDKRLETKNTLKFLDERLTSLTGELNAAEQNVAGFKSSVGLTDISSKSQFFLDNVQQNDALLNEVNVQLNVIEDIERFTTAGGSSTPPATIGIKDPGLISLVDQLTKLQLQKERLLATTPEGNPIFIPLNKQINSTKVALNDYIKSIKNSLVVTQRQLQRNNEQIESSIRSMPIQEQKYMSIKRQQSIKEGLYVYLLQKREETALSYASTLAGMKIIEQPYYDEPNGGKSFPVAVALLFGFLMPIGIIHIRESLRNKVMTREDITSATSAPIICELSHSNDKQNAIVVFDNSRLIIAEQMRILRTNLMRLYGRQEKGKVTLLTSSIASEGKSFVTANIGASLAASGRKTIVLELDLRKPELTRLLNLKIETVGLTSLLKGEVSKNEVIKPSGVHPLLYVMKSGPVPDNPSELLDNVAMEQLINELREEYDNILIDSPPVHLVTDGMILAAYCDVCLYVVRHNYTPKSELKFIDEIYRNHKLPNMNIVFNGVMMTNHFGYHIDYGYYDSTKQKFGHTVFGDFLKRF